MTFNINEFVKPLQFNEIGKNHKFGSLFLINKYSYDLAILKNPLNSKNKKLQCFCSLMLYHRGHKLFYA